MTTESETAFESAVEASKDTDAVLQELGLSPEQIQGLKSRGIISGDKA